MPCPYGEILIYAIVIHTRETYELALYPELNIFTEKMNSNKHQTTTAVVGLGLIGGSIALECKALGHKVMGVDKNPAHQAQALELKLADSIEDIDTVAREADIIIIAIPVNHIEKLLPTLLDKIHPKAVVIDVGSTKKAICEAVSKHPRRGRFVAGHPLAGTEFSGPTAAHTGLFKGKKNLICEEDLSDEDALDTALALFDACGLQSMFMNSDDHDKHLAYVSHLSHVSSFMLGLTVLDIEKDQKQIHNLAGTGFQSTVRLAKSSPQTWSPIFDKNSEYLIESLDSYIKYLQKFKTAVETGDTTTAMEMMAQANDIKRVLNGIRLNVVKLS